MLFKKIPDAELEIMKVIWDKQDCGCISSKEIIKIMEQKKGWKNTTTLTLLSRLSNKKFIKCTKDKRISFYTALISKKSYLGLETSSFFEKIHGNSLKSFITTLNENNKISDKDLDELEKWIKSR